MAFPYAFVTLLTSDSYLPGALTLAAALSDVHPSPALSPEVDFQTVCLVTPETVDIASIKLLRKAFDAVVGVEIIEEDNERGLQLLGMWFIHVAYHLLLLYLCYTSEHEHRAPTPRGIRLSRKGVRFVVTTISRIHLIIPHNVPFHASGLLWLV